jgi:hypothetical protein
MEEYTHGTSQMMDNDHSDEEHYGENEDDKEHEKEHEFHEAESKRFIITIISIINMITIENNNHIDI